MLDAVRVGRAILTNQVARWSPAAYIRLTGQTGRGDASVETPENVAAYFRRCVDDYFDVLEVPAAERGSYLRGKVVLEYGPGDLPGVAALLVGRGAQKVYCVDRFPMVSVSDKNARVLKQLIDGSAEPERSRLLSCLANADAPAEGFASTKIEYLVKQHGLSQLRDAVDLVVSRAVLEHVDDLEATFDDMISAMRVGARAIHLVDLKSHGLHKDNPLDFLAWPPWLWHAMHSHKGVPNRWRVDRYRNIVSKHDVGVSLLRPTTRASMSDVAGVRPKLAQPFKALSDEDLSCLGFWLVFEKS